MSKPEYESAEAIREIRDMALATVAKQPQELAGRRLAWIVPDGAKLQIEDYSKFHERPMRKTGQVTHREVPSLVAYIQRHKTAGTEIFINELTVRAVLNGNEPEQPGWGDHIATFAPLYTTAWTAWTGFEGNWIEQRDFAMFLENRLTEIANPDGAWVMEAVQNLKVKYETTFERVIETTNDFVNLTYREDADTGVIKVPNKLDLRMPMYEGGQTYTVGARLRFSKPDQHGRVKFRFDLGEEVHLIKLEAQRDLRSQIEANLADIPVFIGN